MKIKFLVSLVSFFLMIQVLPATAATGDSPPRTNSKPAGQINLNKADARAITGSIRGIGIKRAEAIIKYREAHGGFKSVNDLSEVPLFGKNFVAKHLKEIEQVFTVNG